MVAAKNPWHFVTLGHGHTLLALTAGEPQVETWMEHHFPQDPQVQSLRRLIHAFKSPHGGLEDSPFFPVWTNS